MAVLTTYTWVYGLSFVFAFLCAFGIGANDVANSFASSVGARALTMWQALVVAAFCEFGGAVLLGASVTDTIKSGVVDSSVFKSTPELLMFGFLCVMITAAFWDNFSCHLHLPVSTTHTTIGATVGMALAIRGGSAIIWNKHKDAFPHISGMLPIFLSWVVSPIMSAICVVILYGTLRTFVLRSEHSLTRAYYVLPVLVGLTVFVVTVFIIQTGNKNLTWHDTAADNPGDNEILWISAVVAIGVTVIVAAVVMPYLWKTIHREEEEEHARQAKKAEAGEVKSETAAPAGTLDRANAKFADLEDSPSDDAWYEKLKATKIGGVFLNNPVAQTLTYGARFKIHDTIEDDVETSAVWEHAEKFDPKTERLFKYCQIFSAMSISFAHGANDVANAMGPFAAVRAIYESGVVSSKNGVPTWILAIGGAGIVVGLATFGYKIMQVLGVKTAKLTNARGFCAELSTAIVVITASRYGLPVSTTQIIVGAIIAVGLFEGAKGINWRQTLWTMMGWVLTLIVAGFVAAAIASFAMYAPAKVQSDNINQSNVYLNGQAQKMLKELRVTAVAGSNTILNDTINTINSTYSSFSKYPGSVQNVQDVLSFHNLTFIQFNATECRAFPFTAL